MEPAPNLTGEGVATGAWLESVGSPIIRAFDVLREIGAFAVITLGVTLTKFNVSRRVIRPLIFAQIWNAGVRLFPMIGFIGAAFGVLIVGQTVGLLTEVGAQQ